VLPRTADEVLGPPGPELLTPREADVLELLQAGKSNGQIAVELSVSVETVRTHARNIYRKLGVRTRRELREPALARR
jgi:DNA-binding NarL/FixJ family response regulator